jgi:hypothetical protein
LLPVFMRRADSSGRHPRICSGSADPRLWGPRFFRSKNHKSHEEESALGLGKVNLRKNRRPQRRRSALRSLLTFALCLLVFLCGSTALHCNTVNSCFLNKKFSLAAPSCATGVPPVPEHGQDGRGTSLVAAPPRCAAPVVLSGFFIWTSGGFFRPIPWATV